MADEVMDLPKKPSFFSSVASGIGGFVKGALSGGIMGIIGGALVGAAVAAIGFIAAPAVGLTTAAIATAIGAEAAIGAVLGGAALATIGAAAGTMTGVIKSREEGQPRAEDIVNVAKISFAQGVAVGHNIEHSAHQQHASKHADKVTTERAAMAMAERQVIQ